MKIRLKHDSGEERLLEWQGITQHMGKMKMPESSEMPYKKDHSVLAVKLNQKDSEMLGLNEEFGKSQSLTSIGLLSPQH